MHLTFEKMLYNKCRFRTDDFTENKKKGINNMAKYRQGRINDEVQRELASILRNIKDPRVQDAFVSVTAVEVTPDLKYAKIYFSFLRGDSKEVLKGLKAASGFIRRELAHTLNLRITPELSFYEDKSLANGAHISTLLNSLTYSESDEDEDKNKDRDTEITED